MHIYVWVQARHMASHRYDNDMIQLDSPSQQFEHNDHRWNPFFRDVQRSMSRRMQSVQLLLPNTVKP
jgi:hypothetical protein